MSEIDWEAMAAKTTSPDLAAFLRRQPLIEARNRAAREAAERAPRDTDWIGYRYRCCE